MTGSEQRTIELQRVHIAMLNDMTTVLAELSAAATVDEVATAMLTTGLSALGADAGYLALVEPDGATLRVRRFAGYGSMPGEQLSVPVDANLPIAHAVRMRTPVFVGSNEELAVAPHAGLERLDPEDHACASLPLLRGEDGPALGAINVRFDTPRSFTGAERHMLVTLATHCSEAMVRAQRFGDEQRRRVAAENALATSRALEINDDIVQLLAEAKLAMELGLHERSAAAIDRALQASKRVVATMTAETTHFRRDGMLEGVRRIAAASSSTTTTDTAGGLS